MTWIDTHASDGTQRVFRLIKWVIGSTYYWTDSDIPIVTGGSSAAPAARWLPMPFIVGGISLEQASEAASAEIEFGSADGVISALVLGNVAAGTSITIYEAWLDPTASTSISQQERLLLAGRLTSWQVTAENVVVRTAPIVPLAGITIPRRIYSTTCSFAFKGAACGYAGVGTDCDRSIAACTAFGNQTRFGGFQTLQPR